MSRTTTHGNAPTRTTSRHSSAFSDIQDERPRRWRNWRQDAARRLKPTAARPDDDRCGRRGVALWRRPGAGLAAQGVESVFAGLGPAPTRDSAARLSGSMRRCAGSAHPLDWMAAAEAASGRSRRRARGAVGSRAGRPPAPQPAVAGRGLAAAVPVVVVSHSCIATWWDAVRGTALPRGLAVAADSAAEAAARRRGAGAKPQPCTRLRAALWPDLPVTVRGQCRRGAASRAAGETIVLAAGRWWDDGKNAATLDAAAAARAGRWSWRARSTARTANVGVCACPARAVSWIARTAMRR